MRNGRRGQAFGVARWLVLAIGVMAATACASGGAKSASQPDAEPQKAETENTPPISLKDRLMITTGEPELTDAERRLKGVYSFEAENMPIRDAMAMFAARYNLNIIFDPEVDGVVSVKFKDLNFRLAMDAILDVYGFFYEADGNLIRVRKYETKLFHIDYVRLSREGKGSSTAQISTGSGGGGSSGGGGGSSQMAGSMSIQQEDKVAFWKELEEQVKTMLSPDGRYVMNRLSGMVQIRDLHKNVERIEDFLGALTTTVARQVEIEARIYEVTLTDDFSLGINWNKIYIDGMAGALQTANIIGGTLAAPSTMPTNAPLGVANPGNPTVAFTYARGDFDAILNAMKEQGEIKVVSQPKILTLNNQPALIKVGTDMPFFQGQTTLSQGTAITTYSTSYVTVGVVLSITPQISADGWIMLDVSPVVTRLVSTSSATDSTGKALVTAPVLDVKQSSTIVRLKDGEMVIIGGLIQDENAETERKVPLLGDIPGMGNLFRGVYTSKVKRELVVFVTPRIKN